MKKFSNFIKNKQYTEILIQNLFISLIQENSRLTLSYYLRTRKIKSPGGDSGSAWTDFFLDRLCNAST